MITEIVGQGLQVQKNMTSLERWAQTMGYLRAASSLRSVSQFSASLSITLHHSPSIASSSILNQSKESLSINFSKMAVIERVTLFKIPNNDDRQRVLEQFKVLVKSATKVRLPL